MVYALTVRKDARPDFPALPLEVRKSFEEAFVRVQEVWSLHVGGYRAWFTIDGRKVRFGAFGLRPWFYRKLARLRSLRRD